MDNEKKILEIPFVWNLMRTGLDIFVGLYRKRFALIREWGMSDAENSVLDVGCGTGHFSQIFAGSYLGVDFNERYIAAASRRWGNERVTFMCKDVTSLAMENRQFDIVLMVGIIHHLDDNAALELLKRTRSICRKAILLFDPLTEQDNFLGRWFIRNDRGHFIRESDSYQALIKAGGLAIEDFRRLRLGPSVTGACLARPALAARGKSSYL